MLATAKIIHYPEVNHEDHVEQLLSNFFDKLLMAFLYTEKDK